MWSGCAHFSTTILSNKRWNPAVYKGLWKRLIFKKKNNGHEASSSVLFGVHCWEIYHILVACKLCSGSPLTCKNSFYFGVYNSNNASIICLLQMLSFDWKFGKIQNISNERKRIMIHYFKVVFFFLFPVLFTLVFSYLIFFPLVLKHFFLYLFSNNN